MRFSILLRIVGDVTSYPAVDPPRRHPFQYPLADRRRCNQAGPRPPRCRHHGFSILLRIVGDVTARLSALAPSLPGCFSILLRIVGDVTYDSVCALCGAAQRFSILLRIVGDVTIFLMPDHEWSLKFQYPLADRRRCNTCAFRCCQAVEFGFSILLRIVGDVTRRPPGRRRRKNLVFQYPLADRRRCNRNGSRQACHASQVSVSSCGS